MAVADGHVFATRRYHKELTDFSLADICGELDIFPSTVKILQEAHHFPKAFSKKVPMRKKNKTTGKYESCIGKDNRWNIDEVLTWVKANQEILCTARNNQ